MAEVASGAYWIGQDGNYYLRANNVDGVVNLGTDPSSNQSFVTFVNSGEYQKIDDPLAPAPSTSGTTSTSGTSSGGTTTNPADIASWQMAIDNTNSALGRLGTQQTSGLNEIDVTTQDALNKLLQAKNTGERNYGDSVQKGKQEFVGAKNTIGYNAGNQLNGLLRLLGSRGVSGTDTNYVAPNAVAGQATLQRGEAQNNFANNQQTLDKNWGDYLQGFNTQTESVNTQATKNRNDLKSRITQNRATLLQNLANASAMLSAAQGGSAAASSAAAQPYMQQANALLDQASNYTTPAVNYQLNAYQAPSLSSYTPKQAAAPTFNGSAQPNSYYNPYLAALAPTKEKDKTQG